jgi:hypothetical protein
MFWIGPTNTSNIMSNRHVSNRYTDEDDDQSSHASAACLALFKRAYRTEANYRTETSPSERLLNVLVASGRRLRRVTHARGCSHVALRVHTHGRL